MLKVLTVIAGGLLLAGCSIVATPFQVRDVQNMTVASAPATGTAFTQALFSEYQAAAKNEAMVENNWVDAVFFVTKGNKAAAGTAVDPEMAADWKGISPAAATELGGARARLMGYFAAGTRERLPAASARAEVDFDCWVEEESEGGDDTGCKTAFLATEKELQAPAPAPVAAAPKIVKTFIVYFDLNKADITPASKAL